MTKLNPMMIGYYFKIIGKHHFYFKVSGAALKYKIKETLKR
jgi:hypothetical protein